VNRQAFLARPNDVEKTPIGQLDEFDDLASDLIRGFWAQLLELHVEPFSQDVNELPPSGIVAEYWQ
jgi:hypothetical protein